MEGIYAVRDEKGKSKLVPTGPTKGSTDAKLPSHANARIINC